MCGFDKIILFYIEVVLNGSWLKKTILYTGFILKKNSLALLRHKADHRRDAVGRVALRSSDQCVQLPG